MVALSTPPAYKGWQAPDFTLFDTDAVRYNLTDIPHKSGLVIAFICNHCPYVKTIADRISKEAIALEKIGVGFIAINSNDTKAYPEDSYENMKIFAKQHQFQFPYFIDETQEVAHKYGAVCTPDFFGFDGDLKLQYRGRLDSKGPATPGNGEKYVRELFLAMSTIASKQEYVGPQFPSIGCSIKWKERS